MSSSPNHSRCGVVYKFRLPAPSITGRSFVTMPTVVEPLSVGIQGDEIVVWAFCQPDVAPETGMATEGPRRFIVSNTGPGIDLPPGARFLGTVTHKAGIVWHVWDGDAETTE